MIRCYYILSLLGIYFSHRLRSGGHLDHVHDLLEHTGGQAHIHHRLHNKYVDHGEDQ